VLPARNSPYGRYYPTMSANVFGSRYLYTTVAKGKRASYVFVGCPIVVFKKGPRSGHELIIRRVDVRVRIYRTAVCLTTLRNVNADNHLTRFFFSFYSRTRHSAFV